MKEPIVALTGTNPEAGQVEVRAPRVGLWRDGPRPGDLVRPGTTIGAIETLGRLVPLVAPAGAFGIVVASPPGTARRRAGPGEDRARLAVGYGDVLLVLDPNAAGQPDDPQETAGSDAMVGRAFVAPMSGRFYVRASPDKEPFVEAGQVVRAGDTVCLLEVMKTFNRVTFGGAGLPAEARVRRVIPNDGDDLNSGDPILELEID